ncbi:serine--tRNA ligase [Maritalea porphyrae]|jgi:seryl-tRNA synthetase|uniref:serine--tRNA ligase n=1 Tax=Maritalea porphyrae TaxID=880732 RepID=UPI0022AFACF5|nr:serine--tRNA ligase [Maritalea porphyrae]MCZ4273153.1 serine--tRNA ligase [Maritalea porphyrae]
MFDVKWIRANPEAFDAGLERRGAEGQSQKIITLDDARKATVQQLNEWQETRNASSKQIGQAKAQGDEEKAQALLAQVADLKSKVQQGEETERLQTAELNDLLAGLPNLLLEDVPAGADENDNVEKSRFAEPRQFNFEPKEHYELGEQLGQMDFEIASKIAGSRFVVLKNGIARLERALGQYMLDLHTTEHGFTEVIAPLLVRSEALFGTGQLPKFSEDAFRTTDDRWLIPTSEVSLTNLVRESMLSHEELPLRFTSLTPCFRSEAGSAGRDTRGMLRQHQFYKVEMVAVTAPDKSLEEHERMLGCAEAVMKGLDIPYRVMRLCAGDMGATMMRTFDIEAWLPGQNTYREISSVSVAGDYQARRMEARYRDENGKPQYVHTLNGSGVATGRALIAVMENYQQEDGSIAIPKVLQPYMGGQTEISAAK